MKGVDQMIEDILKEKKNMTNGEERIADYFLDKKTLLHKQSSRSIASQLFINPSMITRFCQKLGFHGYTDFLEEYFFNKLNIQNLIFRILILITLLMIKIKTL